MNRRTVLRHLTALAGHLEENDFSTDPQDKAMREAIRLIKHGPEQAPGDTPLSGLEDRLSGLLWDYLKRDPEHKDRRQTGWGTKTKQGLAACIERVFNEAKSKPQDATTDAEQGSTCPKCGGHSFTIQATFGGDVKVTFKPSAEDPTDFEVDDSNPGDSEWDGPATCRDCGWDGQLTDLLPAPEAELVEEGEDIAAEHEEPIFSIGQRVQAGTTDEDHDTGKVVAIVGNRVTVAWDSGTTTTQDASVLKDK